MESETWDTGEIANQNMKIINLPIGVGKCGFLGICFTSPKQISVGDEISPIVGWCLMGTLTNPCTKLWISANKNNVVGKWLGSKFQGTLGTDGWALFFRNTMQYWHPYMAKNLEPKWKCTLGASLEGTQRDHLPIMNPSAPISTESLAQNIIVIDYSVNIHMDLSKKCNYHATHYNKNTSYNTLPSFYACFQGSYYSYPRILGGPHIFHS